MPSLFKMHKNYYEAIIQLRPASPEVVDFVKGQIRNRENVFISKEVKLKTGIDLYISSQRLALAIGKKLKRRFKGTIKVSNALYGINKFSSKEVYRVTLCYREEAL